MFSLLSNSLLSTWIFIEVQGSNQGPTTLCAIYGVSLYWTLQLCMAKYLVTCIHFAHGLNICILVSCLLRIKLGDRIVFHHCLCFVYTFKALLDMSNLAIKDHPKAELPWSIYKLTHTHKINTSCISNAQAHTHTINVHPMCMYLQSIPSYHFVAFQWALVLSLPLVSQLLEVFEASSCNAVVHDVHCLQHSR